MVVALVTTRFLGPDDHKSWGSVGVDEFVRGREENVILRCRRWRQEMIEAVAGGPDWDTAWLTGAAELSQWLMNTRFDQSTERRQSCDGETGLEYHEIIGLNRDGGWGVGNQRKPDQPRPTDSRRRVPNLNTMTRHADPTGTVSLMPNQRVGCGRNLLMLEKVK